MAIVLEKTVFDDAGFPIVSWWEDRDIIGMGPRTRVWCYVTPDPTTGTLLFATTGSDRVGDSHNFRPWELLQGFGHKAARELYPEPHHRVVVETISNRLPLTGKLLIDHAVITTADFTDEKQSVPMHLNRAIASEHERALLHDELRRNFLQNRWAFVDANCARTAPFVWPAGKKPFVSPKAPALPLYYDWIGTTIAVAIVGLLAVFIAWFAGVLHF
ncbi:hypothetical protein [Hyphomicrobium sp.]|jgi:hypothetical protein|uniref:hypothetical protein n=1 Tax=Hyphomicrobium sp. TaxID=82 RepID=UPI003568A6F2